MTPAVALPAPAETPVRFVDVAERLDANGYSPVPVKANSKAPAVSDWPAFKVTRGAIQQHAQCGAGLILRDGVHALDVDILDDLAVRVVVKRISEILSPRGVVIARRGKPPKLALLYRDPDGVTHPKLTGRWFESADGTRHRIEVLGDGQQVVAFGVHPKTGSPYRWARSGSPLSVRVDELPAVRRDEVLALVGECEELMLERGLRLADVSAYAAGVDNSDLTGHLNSPKTCDDVPRVSSAVLHLSEKTSGFADRDKWVYFGHALKATASGWRDGGLALWLMASSPYDDYTETEATSKWHTFQPRDDGVGAGTIFREAKALGWVDPAAAAVTVVASDVGHTLNDAGNADRFVAAYEGLAHYVAEARTWITWDGGHWRYDTKGQVIELAKLVARRIFDDASKATDSATRVVVSRWANTSLQLPRLEAMLTLAQATLAVSVSELDADPMLLGVKNGVVELQTGAFRDARPEDLITKIANVEYTSGDTCPTWTAALDTWMAGNRNLIDLLQRASGYSLTGSTNEQLFFFLHGFGRNGKTVFVNTLREIMGGHGVQSQPETIMVQRNPNPSGPTPEVARLAGVRFVAMVETEDGQRLAESRIKQMTGGDAMTARVLHGNPFEFVPSFKLWLAGNHRPVIRGDDDGVWRRIVLIPFTVTIPQERRDKHLPDRLRAEYAGILNWLIDGCLAWQRHGLALPPEVGREVAQYRSDMDLIAQWMNDCCTMGATQTYRARSAYQDYSTWAKDGGHMAMTETRFSQKMTERHFTKKRTMAGMTYHGFGPRQGAVLTGM